MKGGELKKLKVHAFDLVVILQIVFLMLFLWTKMRHYG